MIGSLQIGLGATDEASIIDSVQFAADFRRL